MNLRTCLDMYGDQLDELEGMEVRYKLYCQDGQELTISLRSDCQISLFLSGDFEFL